ncbi:YrdB family protein [Limimaricola sp.]|uniref:YrdB family protein n=1 Tax=Limimaricola sp. TaxID=2211665 RepID=UPI0025C27BB4|nr:YrdB family protein [Limimaricola sp.]
MSQVLAFLVELATLAAYARWGWSWFETPFASVVAALICGGLFALLWGWFAAPKSDHRLAVPLLLVFKLLAFGGATKALVQVGQTNAAALLAAAAGLHLILALWLGDL